jgi:predicted MFS family arabinose efflux permease
LRPQFEDFRHRYGARRAAPKDGSGLRPTPCPPQRAIEARDPAIKPGPNSANASNNRQERRHLFYAGRLSMVMRTTPRAERILAAGFLVLFVGGGARFAIGLTLKPMAEQLSWGRSELGLAVALFQVVSAACMFIAGALADRVSPKLLLGSGLFIGGIGIGLMTLVSAPWHALALYGVVFAVGNGTASIIPVGVMVTRAFPARAGLTNAVASSGVSLGQLVMVAALAAVLIDLGWRSVFAWLGVAHLVVLAIAVAAVPGRADRQATKAVPRPPGMTLREAAGTSRFWLLLGIYAMCGFDDFFVSTHVVAFAQDRGVGAFLAANLLASMGLTALIGVLAGGAWSDRVGPVWPTAVAFAARVGVFVLISLNQSAASVVVFALIFGATFLTTAPLAVVFVRDSFGIKNLGALTGLITMVHHICGGLGAYLGARIFDATSRYDAAFAVMLASSVIALVLTFQLGRRQSQL